MDFNILHSLSLARHPLGQRRSCTGSNVEVPVLRPNYVVPGDSRRSRGAGVRCPPRPNPPSLPWADWVPPTPSPFKRENPLQISRITSSPELVPVFALSGRELNTLGQTPVAYVDWLRYSRKGTVGFRLNVNLLELTETHPRTLLTSFADAEKLESHLSINIIRVGSVRPNDFYG